MRIKIRKYQQGGGVMASIYQPVTTTSGASGVNTAQYAINLLNSGTTGGGSSSSSSSSDKGKITEKDLYTGLYKTIAEQGLISDSQYIINQLQNDLFNESLTNPFGDTSDLTGKYMKALSYVNMAKSNQKLYDEAYKQAVSKDSLHETAVTSDGKVVVKGSDGQITMISPEQYRKNPGNYTLMTNGNLLAERMNNPKMAFQNGVFGVVQNGTSIKEISQTIDAFVKNLGEQEGSDEKLTDDLKIQDGIHTLKQAVAKQGIEPVVSAIQSGNLYKIGITSKSNVENIQLAIESIYNILPENQKTLLELRGGKAALAGLISIQAKESFKFTIDEQSSSDKKDGKSGKSGSGKGEAELNYAEILYHGANEPELVQFGIKNGVIQAMGRRSRITNYQGESMGSDFSYSELYKSQVGSVLKFDQASFGDVPINKALKDRIIIDNDEIVGVDLPYKQLQDGRIVPNFELLTKIRELDDKILQQGLSPSNPSDISKINQMYKDAGLPIKYALDGSGQIQLTKNYKRFAAVQATADEEALIGGYSVSNPTLEVVEDENEQEEYIRRVREITKDKEFSLDKQGLFSFGDRHLVRGTIFIPIGGSAIDARMASSSGKVTGGTTDYDTIRGRDYARQNYVVPEETNLTP